jgi:sugar phosphate isomerase/epimerase
MFTALSPGAIGVSTPTFADAVAAARTGGFDGVEFSIHDVIRRGASTVLDEAGEIKLAGWGFPLNWRGGEDEWKASLDEVDSWGKAAQEVGCLRTMTWIMPMSDTLDFDDNFAYHVSRLKPAADILAGYDVQFGIEFVGPKTLRDQGKYPFVYDIPGILKLAEAIGPNVGVLLDAFHWYTSGGSVADLEMITADKIIYVHVNDGAEGRTAEEQIDNDRRLPLATGAIDAPTFVAFLKSVGYDGPVVTEPFIRDWATFDTDEKKLVAVGDATRRLINL